MPHTMTSLPQLPNEVIAIILRQLNAGTLDSSISQIPELKSLVSLTITDSEKHQHKGNVVTIQDIIRQELSLDQLFKNYYFYQVEITQFQDDKVYMRTHRVLARLLKSMRDIRISYLPTEIDMTYLKMFKSLFHGFTPDSTSDTRPLYRISFPNLRELRSNANHLLISSIVEYPALTAMNLYYCSSKFYFEVFSYLNLHKHKATFPQLTHLKLEDYMNEEEDLYSRHSNNYIRPEDYDDDYDDYDHNSDLDENEFYFDGLEILQNYSLTKLESLTLKNTNMSKLKNINAPELRTLKIFELSNKHIEAFDLNLVDSEHIHTHSFLSSTSVSTSCAIQNNNFPKLSTLKIIGHINLKNLSGNRMKIGQLEEVVVKGANVEIDDKEAFWKAYSGENELMVKY